MYLQKAKDAAFWDKVRTDSAYSAFTKELFEIWAKDCEGDIPACKCSEYIMFNTNGSRSEYEQSYFRRRRALNASAMLSMIYPDNDEYFTKLCDVIFAICDEYNWTVPAHLGNFKDVVIDKIDLFAAETGFALSEIDYLLEDRLPPLIRSRIRYEIDRRIISPFADGKKYWWETLTSNWAAVCAGSVAITFMYQRPDLFESVYPRLKQSLDNFLSGFPDDGICQEGLGYWHYGFGFYVCFADMYYEHTKKNVDLLSGEKIKEIVKFPSRMYLDDNGTSVSFSDSGMKNKTHLGTVYYLKSRFADIVKIPDPSLLYSADNCGRWGLHIRSILWFDPTVTSAKSVDICTDYAPISQWLVKRTPMYGFAAKGGDNEEPHNHNDIGAFIIASGGEQVLCDPGAAKYSKQYFGAERYTFFQTSSRGHSVPIIDGQYQLKGKDRCATAEFSDDIFSIEFSRAYGIEALSQLKRSFEFSDDCVTLTDKFDFSSGGHEITERFVSRFPCEISGDTVRTKNIAIKADGEISIEQNGAFYCIDFKLPKNTLDFHATIKITKQQ